MSNTAARGTIALVSTRGLYFLFGYLAVVVLARELEPAAYGVYGVIMSVLVWPEQSARQAVPTAAAKLIAERKDACAELGKSSLVLNFLLHAAVFLVFWFLAPWLEVWFGIENGAYLFRLAALDLPLFGIYTALQGIHQGRRRFYRLGLSNSTYALAKLGGVLLIVHLGVSIEKALIVNILSSVVGIAFLWTRTAFRREASWRAHAPAILALAAPTALYSVAKLLSSSLHIWILKVMSSAAEAVTIGVYMAALNIARVPGSVLFSVSLVLLPSVSRAIAAKDSVLIRHYTNQALRFFLILYLPICLVLFARPEELMQWVYSSKYAEGGGMLVILTIGDGLWAIQGILASVLLGVGRARILGAMTALTLVFYLPVLVALINVAGGRGAATATGLVALANVVILMLLLRQQFGAIVQLRNMSRIGAAGALMVAVSALVSALGGGAMLVIAAGLLAYSGTLILLAEVSLEDFAAVLPHTIAK